MPNGALIVVELRRSRRYSLCPPRTSDIQERIESPNLLVLTYWARLEWTDIFANPTSDQRPWAQTRALQRKTVYASQLIHDTIANGQIEGVEY